MRRLVRRASRRLFVGGAAGLLATMVMTAFMEGARRAGWIRKLPPEAITERALHAVGARPNEAQKDAAATAAHLAFGIGAGALYGLLPGPTSRRMRLAAGTAYGLAIWVVSYAGWAPALRLMPAPSEDRPDSQATILASHVVYGVTLGSAGGR